MIQVINFYEKLEPRTSTSKTLVYIWLAWFAVLAFYLAWSLVLFSQQRALADGKTRLVSSISEMEGQLLRESAMGESADIISLERDIADLRKTRIHRRLLVKHLEMADVNKSQGFSVFMVGLAQQHERGISLDKIELSESGKRFAMQGKLARPEMLPAYIVRLGGEQAFQKMNFETVEINEAEHGLAFRVLAASKL